MKKILLICLIQLFAFNMLAQTLENQKTEIVTLNPTPGHYDELPAGIVLTFSDKIGTLEYALLRTSSTGASGYALAEDDYIIADSTLTITLPEEYLAYNPQAILLLQVKDVNGQYVTYGDVEDYITLDYTAPVRADIFAGTAITPEDGSVVDELSEFTLTFTNPKDNSDFVGGMDASKAIVLTDLTDAVVATGTAAIAADNGSTIIITLDKAVSEAGTYTLVVPEATVLNSDYDATAEGLGIEYGAIYNPEFTATFTIVASVGIETVIGNAVDHKVYDVKGRLVGNSVKNLKKGFYIINGEKVMVK